MNAAVPEPTPLALTWLLAYGVCCLLMVWVMVRFSAAVLERREAKGWWLAYAGLWVLIVALALFLPGVRSGPKAFDNQLLIALVGVAFWTVHAALLWLMLSFSQPGAEAESLPGDDRQRDARRALGGVALTGSVLLVALVLAMLAGADLGDRLVELASSPRRLALAILIGLVAGGFALFMGTILHMLIAGPAQPLDPDEERELLERHRPAPATVGTLGRVASYRPPATRASAGASLEFSLGDLKRGLRDGSWRHDAVLRHGLLVTTGVLLAIAGGCGIALLVAPWPIKLLVGAVLSYMIFQLGRGWLRA